MSFKRKFFRHALLLGATFCLIGGDAMAANFSVDNLKVNRISAPLGLDDKNPVFGWQMKSDLKTPQDIQQNFYQITVKNSVGEIFWDSG